MNVFSETEAIQLWFWKWLGVKKHEIAARVNKNMFRIYEVYKEEENIGSRLKAWALFQKKFPIESMSVDPSPHKQRFSISKKNLSNPNQYDMFSNRNNGI